MSQGEEGANRATSHVNLRMVAVTGLPRRNPARMRPVVVRMLAEIVRTARRMTESAKAMQPLTADHRRGEEAQNAPGYCGVKASH